MSELAPLSIIGFAVGSMVIATIISLIGWELALLIYGAWRRFGK